MKRKDITRRKFIAMTSLGMTGAYMGLNAGLARAMMGSGGGGMGGGGGGMGGGGMGGGTTVIDPPPGAAFYDIPDAEKVGGVYKITAGETRLRLNGTRVTLLTYNGTYPGPVIRAARGETLKVQLVNNLPKTTATNILGHTRNITNLHTHGLHVSPST